jgi:hypothetical protein
MNNNTDLPDMNILDDSTIKPSSPSENNINSEQNYFDGQEKQSKVKNRGESFSKVVSTFSKNQLHANDSTSSTNDINERNLLSFSKITEKYAHKNENLNTFSSIFKKDHEAIEGIKRVFRKSMIFLVIKSVLFALVAFLSVNVFSINIFVFISLIVLYIIASNIYFIIVADKSYVFVSILIELVFLFLAHLSIDQAFHPVTILLIAFITMFSYFAYSELEKVQLGSRLFSIGQITNESTSALLTMLILLSSLGVYNTIAHNSLEKIVSKSLLDNSFIFNKFVIGSDKGGTSLNSLYNLSYKTQNGGKPTTLDNFLSEHFRKDKEVITETEKANLREECGLKKTVEECAGDKFIETIRISRLEEWKRIAYPNVKYSLDTPIDQTKFKELTKQYFLNQVCMLEKGEDCERNKPMSYQQTSDTELLTGKAKVADAIIKDIPISSNIMSKVGIDRSDIIPVILSLALFILLSIIKPLIRILLFATTSFFWQLLKLFGFVKIEIETVEAEVVSI